MTSPNLASDPISNPYALVANATNLATSSLSEFASWTREDWEDFITGQWPDHFSGIGVPIAALWEWINAIGAALGGDPAALEELLGEAVEGLDLSGLAAAIVGTYTGDDTTLTAIQSAITVLRSGLTGIIDWSRIPQISLSQLTNAAGPNL
ncbi:MAG: hypothetical protein QM662_02375, partial [Gordonia sp. (in: high G+C Gram-positive bacteria)]